MRLEKNFKKNRESIQYQSFFKSSGKLLYNLKSSAATNFEARIRLCNCKKFDVKLPSDLFVFKYF